ncbi:MAG TPA: CPBP family intramembrane glutamic endopeptidase [Bryobacteraceae bacterium]|nr:CPBP family intramembrane glutamic endopeptidase [Bryobacteraceae bacterium]
MLPTPPTQQNYLGVVVRVGVFALVAILGYFFIFPVLIMLLGVPVLVVATIGTFAAAAVANAIALRIYERGRLADIGLGWTAASRRNLSLGVLGGLGAAMVVVLGPVAVRAADVQAAPNEHFQLPSLLFVSIILLFGAVGEEMLFRGYGFQVLVKAIGPFATILPTAVLFGLGHSYNINFNGLALFNTILWGVVLGWAFVRSGDLWLPIGLHFGWNWALPLLGVNLSGFTMGITGYSIHWKIGQLWSGGAYGPEGGLLTSAVAVVLFFYLQKAPIQHQEAFLLREES